MSFTALRTKSWHHIEERRQEQSQNPDEQAMRTLGQVLRYVAAELGLVAGHYISPAIWSGVSIGNRGETVLAA